MNICGRLRNIIKTDPLSLQAKAELAADRGVYELRRQEIIQHAPLDAERAAHRLHYGGHDGRPEPRADQPAEHALVDDRVERPVALYGGVYRLEKIRVQSLRILKLRPGRAGRVDALEQRVCIRILACM